MALRTGTMTTHSQSWAAVEEKLQMDIAIWKSEAALESRPKEYRELVEGAAIKLRDRGMAIISIGKLEWEVTPPSVYTGYCDKQDDWLLVSGSRFRVALRCPQGRGGVLQVCPCSEDWSRVESFVGVDGELNDMLTRFLTSEETGTLVKPTLRRTMSQKKRAEIIGKNFGPPFVRCVNALQHATGISDVLDIVLGFSAAYVSNQQILQQVPEEFDVDDCYFYDKEDVEEELRLFNANKRNDSLWVRYQVKDAATKCLAAVEATSEAVHLGVGMLLKMQQEAPLYDTSLLGKYTSYMLRMSQTLQKGNGEEIHNPLVVYNHSNLETNEVIKLNPSSSSGLHIDNVIKNDNPESGAGNPSSSSLDNQQNESGHLEGGNNPPSAFLRTPSFGSDMGNDTFSETSWDLVQAQTNDTEPNDTEVEDDFLGAGISDAESLDMMLRERDPCGSSDCSNLINEFVNLKLSSSSSKDQEQNVGGLEKSGTSVLKRLESWSSSKSGWPECDILPSPGPLTSRRIGTVQLETLAEEPACDPETARLCLAFTRRAAAIGDVLQWCSCKFNKARSSIELRFQVGSFMEDDIATLSTGIVRGSSLRIEIFLDATNMRQSLLEGKVRISVDQGLSTEVSPPVVGLSCYIPHLVRHYLKRHIQEQSNSGYEFPDGELLTGLMKHVVAKLVSMKHSCCVCDHEAHPDPIKSFVPRPCDQNLCQALHEAWLVVAPQMVLEQSTIEYWLRTYFQPGNSLDEARMLQYMDQPVEEWVKRSNYPNKLSLVLKWLQRNTLQGSWLKVITYAHNKTKEELDYGDRLLAIERKNYRPEAAQ